MGFSDCADRAAGCFNGVISVDWGDMQAKYAAVEKLHGGIDLVTAKQWDQLADVYKYDYTGH